MSSSFLLVNGVEPKSRFHGGIIFAAVCPLNQIPENKCEVKISLLTLSLVEGSCGPFLLASIRGRQGRGDTRLRASRVLT